MIQQDFIQHMYFMHYDHDVETKKASRRGSEYTTQVPKRWFIALQDYWSQNPVARVPVAIHHDT